MATIKSNNSQQTSLTIDSLSKCSTNHSQNIFNAKYIYNNNNNNNSYLMPVYITNRNQYLALKFNSNTNNNTNQELIVGNRIKPSKSSNRRDIQKLTWRSSQWIKGFNEEEEEDNDCYDERDISSNVAIRRILLLYENLQYIECANFINRLNNTTFLLIVNDLPIDVFIETIPHSLPILESLYAKVFLTSNHLNGFTCISFKLLRSQSVVTHMVRMFAIHNPFNVGTATSIGQCSQPIIDPNHPLIISCKKLLKVIILSEPELRKQIYSKKRSLDKAIEGMGHHGLVGTTDHTLMSLHEALKLEFERVIQQYKTAIAKLEELCLAKNREPLCRSLSCGPAPTHSSHQRLLSLRQNEIQERLIKNKTLLNTVEPCAQTNHALQILLSILHNRIEYDKDVLFQFTQLRKEYSSSSSSSSSCCNMIDKEAIVAPILMKFSDGCEQVLNLMNEVQDRDSNNTTTDDSSDISGYHSDSDSTLHFQNCKTVAKKYNTVLYRSAVPIKSTTIQSNNETQQLESLTKQLIEAKQTINELKENENKLRQTLEKQSQTMVERGISSSSSSSCSSNALITKYGNLYAQARVDTLDALDALEPLIDADELKSKLLFSVVVLAFRSVEHSLTQVKRQINELLQIPDKTTTTTPSMDGSVDPEVKHIQCSIDTYLRTRANRL